MSASRKSGAAATSEMATAKSLRFGLQLSALIGGKVKMTEVTLIDPVIAVPQTQTAGKSAEDAAAPQADGGSPAAALKSLSLDKLLIKNGTLILPGSGGAPGKRIEALNLEASMPAPDATLAFDGSASLDGQKIQAAGSIGGLAQLLDGKAVPVSLDIEAPSYLEEKAALNGIASYKGDSFVVSQFTARAGDKSLAGSGSYKGSLLTLHPLTLNASGNSLSGSVVADLSGAVPAINAAFAGQTLNLDALLSQARRAPPAASGSGGSGGEAGWSDARIDFSALKAVTAKLKLTARPAHLQQDQDQQRHASGHDLRRQALGVAAELPALWRRGRGGARCRCERQDRRRSGSGCRSRISMPIPSSRTVRDLKASKAPARSRSTSPAAAQASVPSFRP